MKYPAIFFYKNKRNTVIHTFDPKGAVLDVPRFIQQKAPWKKVKSVNTEKKKALILADWTANKWTYKKITAVKKNLHQLLNDGFTVYQWQNNETIELTHTTIEELDNYFIRHQINPSFEENIIHQTIKQHPHLKQEEIHVLNDYWLAVLDPAVDEHSRQFDIAHFNYTTHDKKILYSWIKKQENDSHTSPKIEKLINTEFSYSINSEWDKTIANLPSLPIINTYKTLKFNTTDAETLLNKHILTIEKKSFTIENLSTIESLELNIQTFIVKIDILHHLPVLDDLSLYGHPRGNHKSKLNLSDLGVVANQLILLTLNDCQLVSADKFPYFPILEKLDLSCTAIDASLNTFFGNFTQLKHLKIHALDENLEEKFFDDYTLLFLESLHVMYCRNNAFFLGQLLKNKNKLRSLKLENCDLPNLLALDIDFPALEKFECESCQISNESMNFLFLSMPKLKILSLNFFHFTEPLEENIALPELIKLEISDCNITFENLLRLLKHAEKLNSISLSNCNIIFQNKGSIPPLPLSLVSLTEFNLFRVNLDAAQLEFLLYNAPSLINFSMRNCIIEGSVNNQLNLAIKKLWVESCDVRMQTYIVSLTEVDNLYISQNPTYSDIFYEESDIHYILQDTRKLRLFELHNVSLLNPFDTFLFLDHLEALTFGSLDITAENFIKITNSASLLRSLHFTDVNFYDDLNYYLSFPHVHTLKFVNGEISIDNLLILIHAMPALQFLKIDRIANLDNHDPQLIHLLKERGITVESSNNNQQNNTINPVNTIPLHRPDTNLTTLPPPDPNHFQFNYQGKNKTKNQDMIIEKLSQYLTLTQHPEAAILIPKIQGGICDALTIIFDEYTDDSLDDSLNNWNHFLNIFQQWNGQLPIPEPLHLACIKLLKQYKLSYCQNNPTRLVYLGDAFNDWIESRPSQAVYVQNPWHVVLIKHKNKNSYFYDPNNQNGYEAFETQQTMMTQTHHSLGTLLSVKWEKGVSYPAPIIKDGEAFIRDGGLLVLDNLSQPAHSATQFAEVLNQLPKPFKMNQDFLEQGLLLRGTLGQPAWYLALINPHPQIKQFITQLLCQYTYKNPLVFADQLANSMAHLSNYAQFDCIAHLRLGLSSMPQIADRICDAIMAKQDEVQFTKQFEIWKQPKPIYPSEEAYYQHLINKEKFKYLVNLPSSQEIENMALALQLYCQGTHPKRPVYYIHSPEEIVCLAPYIEKQNNKGMIQPGPGGKLHHFLTQTYDKQHSPILIINYNHFDPEDIKRSNSLLGKPPKADSIPFPDETVLIGLINFKKLGCDKDDFSLFGINGIENCPIKPTLKPSKIETKTDETKNGFTIDFCHAQNWKEKLLGQWVIQKDSLIFKKGILEKALSDGQIIELKNGLWNDESFCFFWKQFLALGYLEYEDKLYQIKQHQFIKSEDYDWEVLQKQFQLLLDSPSKDTLILNPALLNEFFNHYECEKTKTLAMLPGYIAAHHHQTLNVRITRSLSENEWGMLLNECHEHQVILNIYCESGVNLSFTSTVGHSFSLIDTPDQVIETNDIDAAVSMTTKNGAWEIIDISECHPNDLLTHIDGNFDTQKLTYTFEEKQCALLKALEDKKQIVLMGTFSAELIDSLAPLLFSRQGINDGSKILMISNNASLFTYLPVTNHIVTLDDKLNIIREEYLGYTLPSHLWDYSLTHIRSQLTYALATKSLEISPFAPWAGLLGLSGGIQLADFNETNSTEEAEIFIDLRKQALFALLNYFPCVFLTGLTGVGKSTFVEQLASQDILIFIGEENALAWATDPSDCYKILFIDEANLSLKQWSEYEGLFHFPPSVLLKGDKYPMTGKHKVIAAGNPLNYGGERGISSLFARHGAALIFEPLSLAFIYEKILKPILMQTMNAEEILPIAKIFLSLYQFLCACSEEEVLISPRELQMMALLTPAHALPSVAQYYAYHLAKNLVPNKYQAAFDQNFAPIEGDLPILNRDKKIHPFLVTESRKLPYQQLSDFIHLRESRRAQKPHLTDAQLYGGLGGIILKGEKAAGKKELTIACLKNHGYREVALNTPSNEVPDNAFYCIPPSMQPDDIERLLKKAFDEGAIVIIQNSNSIPLPERLLNELLMGKITEAGKVRRPHHPGFMMIGIQPILTKEFYQHSNALLRRLMTITLPTYTKDELIAIVVSKGVKLEKAELMVNIYLEKQQEALNLSLHPLPNTGTLMEVAEAYVLKLTKNEIKNTGDKQWIGQQIKLSTQRCTLFSESIRPPFETRATHAPQGERKTGYF